MKNILPTLLVALGIKPAISFASENSLYSFKVQNIEGQEVSLDAYKGKVVLIVNVASKCGFTYQYEGLEKVYNQYKAKGFVILGFPSNDFGGQEPGNEKEIKEFCKLTYSVDFPLFKKNPVSGKEIQPLFRYLTTDANSAHSGKVLWNFEKFLFNKKGQLVERYRSITKPDSEKVTKEIEKLLNEI